MTLPAEVRLLQRHRRVVCGTSPQTTEMVEISQCYGMMTKPTTRHRAHGPELKYAEGLPTKQIASVLGRAPGTIGSQLSAAKKAAALLFADTMGDFDIE